MREILSIPFSGQAQLLARDSIRLLHQCIDHLSNEKAEAVRLHISTANFMRCWPSGKTHCSTRCEHGYVAA